MAKYSGIGAGGGVRKASIQLSSIAQVQHVHSLVEQVGDLVGQGGGIAQADGASAGGGLGTVDAATGAAAQGLQTGLSALGEVARAVHQAP